jgi:hypothetical protein
VPGGLGRRHPCQLERWGRLRRRNDVTERSEHAGRIWGAQPACTPGTLDGRAFVKRLGAPLPEAPPFGVWALGVARLPA